MEINDGLCIQKVLRKTDLQSLNFTSVFAFCSFMKRPQTFAFAKNNAISSLPQKVLSYYQLSTLTIINCDKMSKILHGHWFKLLLSLENIEKCYIQTIRYFYSNDTVSMTFSFWCLAPQLRITVAGMEKREP